ncbi:MAG: helix-turn-helix domain-containing protein [Chloroflexia bacterium]
MLDRLLSLLREGKTRTVPELARELGVTPPLVEMMLEELAVRGYLRSLPGSCGGRCEGCPLAGACAAGGTRIWSISLAPSPEEKAGA